LRGLRFLPDARRTFAYRFGCADVPICTSLVEAF